MTDSQSIRELILQTFPGGTSLGEVQKVGKPDHVNPPDFPPDLFAVAGVLLQRAGAYQHVISAERMSATDFPDKSESGGAKVGHGSGGIMLLRAE